MPRVYSAALDVWDNKTVDSGTLRVKAVIKRDDLDQRLNKIMKERAKSWNETISIFMSGEFKTTCKVYMCGLVGGVCRDYNNLSTI